jgi:predicted nucleic acid-binding Zn ribbon protein
MARVASPTCDLCGKRKMKRIYVRSGSTFVGTGWACGCDSRSVGIEEHSKGWGIITRNAQ